MGVRSFGISEGSESMAYVPIESATEGGMMDNMLSNVCEGIGSV